MTTDFIVIGSGLAGLTAALVLQKHGEVLLISKSRLDDCATNLAQGGIAAVVEKDDSFKSHIKDTLVAGNYHNNQEAVEYMVTNAPSAIDWLVKQGVHFEKINSHFSPTREAAHLFRRVLHATDFTGRELERALLKQVKKSANIAVWENCFAFNLLVSDKICAGVQVTADGEIINCLARAVVLATGGVGQLYQWTTNPMQATGDGIALGVRGGAEVTDLEFIQFHPTALKNGNSPLFLLSEAIRGEGAHLKKFKVKSAKFKVKDGKRFMDKIDKRGELAPRDIVARAIFREQQEGYDVFLDIRHKEKDFLQKRFPNIYLELTKRGFDLSKDLIPVTPAAHYSCGGIKVDLFGRTNITNLFAFGEVACAQVHGANRLASNSLLEAVVFPLRMEKCHAELVSASPPKLREILKRIQDDKDLSKLSNNLTFTIQERRKQLQQLMWGKVGIIRFGKQLSQALAQIIGWEEEVSQLPGINSDLLELKNMILAAKLITIAALKRKKSLGAHYIIDSGR